MNYVYFSEYKDSEDETFADKLHVYRIIADTS